MVWKALKMSVEEIFEKMLKEKETEVKEKMREYRQRPEVKEKMREYYFKNREKILAKLKKRNLKRGLENG